jgi:diaminopimelate epimerase
MHHELVAEHAKARFAKRCCQRNFGIGSDGILFLVGSSRADLGMRLFQPDGSEAEMCGNGIRCSAKYAWETGYVGQGFNLAMGFLVLSIIAEIPRNFGSREHAESLACQWALPAASYTFWIYSQEPN